MKQKFNVGDRVIVIESEDGYPDSMGKIGIIRRDISRDNWYLVEFDDWHGGWDCHSQIADGRGLFCSEEGLELLEIKELNVGDVVVVKSRGSIASEILNGKIGRITKINITPLTSSTFYRLDIEKIDKRCCGLHAYELTFIDEEEYV